MRVRWRVAGGGPLVLIGMNEVDDGNCHHLRNLGFWVLGFLSFPKCFSASCMQRWKYCPAYIGVCRHHWCELIIDISSMIIAPSHTATAAILWRSLSSGFSLKTKPSLVVSRANSPWKFRVVPDQSSMASMWNSPNATIGGQYSIALRMRSICSTTERGSQSQRAIFLCFLFCTLDCSEVFLKTSQSIILFGQHSVLEIFCVDDFWSPDGNGGAETFFRRVKLSFCVGCSADIRVLWVEGCEDCRRMPRVMICDDMILWWCFRLFQTPFFKADVWLVATSHGFAARQQWQIYSRTGKYASARLKTHRAAHMPGDNVKWAVWTTIAGPLAADMILHTSHLNWRRFGWGSSWSWKELTLTVGS